MSSARAIGVGILLCAATAAIAGPRVIPPGQEMRILALAAPLQLEAPVAAGYRLTNIGIGTDGFSFILEGDGLATVQLRVTADEGFASHRFELLPPESEMSAAGRTAAARLRELVAPRIDAAFWESVLSSPAASAAPEGGVASNIPTLAAALFAMALIAWLDIHHRSRGPAAAIAALVALAPLGVWYGVTRHVPGVELEAWLQERERQLVQVVLAVAAAAGGLAAVAALRWRPANRAAWLDAGLVLAWSVFVRFALTSANVLTDGGSGWSRLLEYRRGFGAIAVLVDAVLPGAAMWDAIAVPHALAALSPPLLVLLAGAIGAPRGAGALGGLALASLPVHAALYASDFESGAVVSLLLAGLALVAHGGNRDSANCAAAGLALLGFGIFGRPEMMVVGLPLLALAPRLVAFRRSPAVVAAAAWLLALAAVRIATLAGLANTTPSHFGGPWTTLPFGELLTTRALFPYWLWLPLPLGVWFLKHSARRVTLAGLVAALLPLHVTPTMSDPTETYLEFFRYGTFAMPWLALLAGAGVNGLAAETRLPAVRIAVALWMLATPVLERDYLALRYGPAVDEAVFREALLHVPEGCQLIVPDDPETFFDVYKRYVEIARDVAAIQPKAPPPGRVIGVSEALRDLPRDGCWYFFAGSYCHDGFDGVAPPTCRQLLESAPFTPAWSRTTEYRSHRLVTRPRRTVSPWYESRLELTLYRMKVESRESRVGSRRDQWKRAPP